LGPAITATISKPAVALGLAAILVLIIGARFRRLWFERLVRLPGPVLVHDVSVPSDLPGVDVAGLNTSFRQRLQELRLQTPTPVPGAIPTQNFLEMLDSDRLNAKNPLATVVRILQAATPTHAYEVSPALVVDRNSSCACRYGAAAQVTRLPHEAIPVETAWANSHAAAVLKAADIVTAAILPRTRLSKRPPWSGWRRYEMPSLLVHHFELAQELCSQRRYEEALDHSFSALKLDPKSVDLRLHLGFVQEKLGLFVDALAAYAAARKVEADTSSALYGYRSRRNRAASRQIACYRLAVLLAGKDLAEQWRDADEDTLRGVQGARVRTAQARAYSAATR
jgi:tetratricopeptide (TPR) repeat protein